MPVGAGDPARPRGAPPRHARGDRRRRGGQPDRQGAERARRSPRRGCSPPRGAATPRRSAWSTRRPGGSRWRSPPCSPVLDPELVILGGGIGGNGDLLLGAGRARARPAVPVPATHRGRRAGRRGRAARRRGDRAAALPRSSFSAEFPTVTGGRSSYETSTGEEERNEISVEGALRPARACARCAGRRMRRQQREQLVGGGGSAAPSEDKTPVTLTLWHPWTGDEKKIFEAQLRRSTPSIRGSPSRPSAIPDSDTFDDQVIKAIKGGNGPDAVLSFGPDYDGQYCSSGLMQDLSNYMDQDGVSHRPVRAGRDHVHAVRRQAVHAARR